jgi:PAS domain S-box-containing protein
VLPSPVFNSNANCKLKTTDEYADMDYDDAETKRLKAIEPQLHMYEGQGEGGGGGGGGGGEKGKLIAGADFELIRAVRTAKQNFVITDALLPDNPIIYASSGFFELTGYTAGEVIGRNCRFLQGPKTDPGHVRVLSEGCAKGDDTSVMLLNYRKDGSTFLNQLFVAALRDIEGQIVNFVGVQCEVVKNNVADGALNNGGGGESDEDGDQYE